ncbi:MAG: fibronectin type III domain-containing protein [Flavobacteriales bacterium]
MNKAYYLVKLGLDRISPSGLLVKARNMVIKITGNPAYPTPVPPLVDITASADAMEATINAFDLNPGPGERIDRDVAFAKLKGNLVELAGYVQAASNGDLETIKSAGLSVRRDAEPIGPLPAPKRVVVRTTAYPGVLDVSWGGVKGRSMYELEWCSGDPKTAGDWKVLLLTSKNRFTVENLTSNEVYFFRVKAIGAAGASPLSDTAQAKAA